MNDDFNAPAIGVTTKEPYWKIGDTYKFRNELQNGGQGRAYVSQYGLPYEVTLIKEYEHGGRDFVALQGPDEAFGLSKYVADEVYTNQERLQLKPVMQKSLPGFDMI